MGSSVQVLSCRREECADPVIAKGLCARHWARWYRGIDEPDIPGDDAPAPPQQVWWPPERSAS
ncbi:hypothetical protein [Amycolatopsis anabasis]|uniref:hypothetical protein n=1 Tax=Amycolatopsis anabasis TaxID=1840409 RepID=UPI00131C36B3|nr:hypothetical protein [Amycolatopsis anabasis]